MKILFIQPHKTVLTEDLHRNYSPFLAGTTDKFARVVPSLPAMTVLGALPDYENYFIDATAEDPYHFFPYNRNIHLIGMSDAQILDRVSKIKPNIVLMTSMFTSEYFAVNRIIRLIKSNFKIPIVVGGHHATLRPNWHLEAGANLIALGEGESNIEEIVNWLNRGNGRNIQIQRNQEVLDSLDRNWDIETVLKKPDGTARYPLSIVTRNPQIYFPENTNLSENAGVIYASRGCPHDCEYCNATARDGKKIRHMSLEKMIALTEKFISLGANTFYNESDTFGIHPTDREYLKWVSEQRANGRNINLANTNSFFAAYFFQNERFLPERVDLLRDAGFRTITVSIESFNEQYNRGKLRGITIPLLRDCFSYIRQQGLNLDVYMMYLFPEQTEEELKGDMRDIDLLSEYTNEVTWRSLMYFPGTIYYDWAIGTGRFSESEYRKLIEEGISFYHVSERFNFSKIKNPPRLIK